MTPPNQPQNQPVQTPQPISLRYTCAANGDQVGLSHYLMAEAQKDK
jgi:modified peptide precursor CbpA